MNNRGRVRYVICRSTAFVLAIMSMSLAPAMASEQCPAVVYFGNGVDTHDDVATTDMMVLRNFVIQEIAKDPSRSVLGFDCFQKAFVATGTHIGGVPVGDWAEAGAQIINDDTTAMFVAIERMLRLYTVAQKQAAAWYLNSDFITDFKNSTGAELREQVKEYRRVIEQEHSRVIVVAHSQGLLFANEAYKILTEALDGGSHIPKDMFNIVAVAPPNFVVSGEPWTTFYGDIINAVPTAPLPNTDIDGSECDQSLKLIDWLTNLPDPDPKSLFSDGGLAIQCHDFGGSYLAGTYSYRRIMKQLLSHIPGSAPPVARISVDGLILEIGTQFHVTELQEPVKLESALSSSPNGMVGDVTWSVNDDPSVQSDQLTVSKPPGIYHVVLTVADQFGLKSSPAEILVIVDPVPSPLNQPPTGSLDGVNNLNQVFGWAGDPDNPDAPIVVHLYVDKNAGTPGATPMLVIANQYRSDVGNHAFNWDISSALRDGQTHTVWAWGIDLTDPVNNNALLSGSPTTFNVQAETGLVAYYTFEGDANDHSGNGNDGTLFGDVTFASGKVGEAARFDGTTGYIAVPDSLSLRLYTFTLSAWVNPSAIVGGNRIVEKGSSDSYWLDVNPIGQPLVGLFDGAFHDVAGPTGLQPNVWHLVTGTYDGTVLRTYLDGILVGSVGLSVGSGSPFQTPEQLIIGWKLGGIVDDHFAGLIDELRIYNRALSPSEVQALYIRTGGTPARQPLYQDPASNVRFGSPVLDQNGNLIVLGFQDDANGNANAAKVYSISSAGRLNWKMPDGSSYIYNAGDVGADFLLLGRNGNIYVSGAATATSTRNTIFAFSQDGGSLAGWPVTLHGPQGFLPERNQLLEKQSVWVSEDGTVFALAADFIDQAVTSSTLYALNADGSIRWQTRSFPVSSRVVQGPNGGVFSTVNGGLGFPELYGLTEFDPITGAKVCGIPLGNSGGGFGVGPQDLIGGNDGVFGIIIEPDNSVEFRPNDSIIGFDTSCHPRNVFTSLRGLISLSSAVLRDRVIYALDFDQTFNGNVIAVDGNTGALIWRNQDVTTSFGSPLTVTADRVYTTGVVLRRSDGQILRQLPTSPSLDAPDGIVGFTADDVGNIYFSGGTNRLYSMR